MTTGENVSFIRRYPFVCFFSAINTGLDDANEIISKRCPPNRIIASDAAVQLLSPRYTFEGNILVGENLKSSGLQRENSPAALELCMYICIM